MRQAGSPSRQRPPYAGSSWPGGLKLVALEITKAREAEKMTQGDLANAIKTKQQTVSRIERGAQNVTIETLDRIAKALGRDLQVRFVHGA